MKLRKSTFRYIEQEIYTHPETKVALDELTEDIILATPPYQEIRTLEPSDPTGTSASLLATNKLRMRMIDTVYAIDISFIELTPEYRDPLEDKYWKRSYLTWEDIAQLYHVERRTLYRWRSGFVADVARRLGLY